MTAAPLGPRRPIELVISDVDGTLVTTNKALTDRAIAAVARLREAGVGFTLVSGRPPRGMMTLVEALQVRLPFAGFNGGNIVAPEGAVLNRLALAAGAGRAMLALLEARGVDAWVFADGDWRLRDPQGVHVERERRTVGFDPLVVSGFDDVIGRIDKLVGVSADHDRLAALEIEARALLGADATVERSQPYYLDVTHPRANKGEAVRALTHLAGVALERTAVIGDMFNDTAMFALAGVSVAMGQAPPAVQASATFVTGGNDHDGFAQAVARLVAGGEASTFVVLMGVSGAGKTTVGEPLARRLGWLFQEGDDLHPRVNVAKMHAGLPLDDADRAPWLAAIAARMDEWIAAGRSAVVTCSALKRAYRQALSRGRPQVRFVFLSGSRATLEARLEGRRGHFMPASLLGSQLADLEAPAAAEHVIVVDIDQPVPAQVERIIAALRTASPIPNQATARGI